jgi:hypothetical protein
MNQVIKKEYMLPCLGPPDAMSTTTFSIHNCSLKEKNYNQEKPVILDLCNTNFK